MTTKVPVSTIALELRVKRALAKTDELLRKNRPGSNAERQMGQYFIVDSRNNITATNIDLEKTARELGLMKDYEEVMNND